MTPGPTLRKTDFDDIYDRPDPRAYYSALEPLEYLIPQHGADVCTELLGSRGAAAPARILDVCCSYGMLGALLKTDLRLSDLYRHYGTPAMAEATPDRVADADRRLLREHAQPDAPHVTGLDLAKPAVDYAVATGALDAGAAENLEEDEPSAELASLLADVDLITTTGGIGYVSERTFERLLRAARPSVWVAAFCLRTYDFAPIRRTLEAHGLVVEKSTRTFPQRRFTGPDEERWALESVAARGLDPAGVESDGRYHAELFVARPAAEAGSAPRGSFLD